MKNLELLIENIPPINHKKNNDLRKDKIIIDRRTFDSNCIFYIIEHFNWKIKLGNKSRVKIEINSEIISDDATLMVFESLIYLYIKKYAFNIQYVFNVNKNLIGYDFYKMNNLFKYDNKEINKEKFIKDYEKIFELTKYHYRKVCKNTSENRQGEFLSLINDEVCTFMKFQSIEKEYYEILGETIVEILGNCLEHTSSDTVLDIKITNGYRNNKEYKFLNITVLTFTKEKFGEKLKNVLFDKELGYNKSNKIVKQAYNLQRERFNDLYDIDSFLMISSFQKDVTTRKNSEGTGGKGLTIFIETLIDSAIDDYCYVLNSNTVILLKKPFLRLNNDGTIGFNDKNDYFNELPNQEVVTKLKNTFNGTIHNLTFILGGDKQ